jgi:urease accessory protein UreH
MPNGIFTGEKRRSKCRIFIQQQPLIIEKQRIGFHAMRLKSGGKMPTFFYHARVLQVVDMGSEIKQAAHQNFFCKYP